MALHCVFDDVTYVQYMWTILQDLLIVVKLNLQHYKEILKLIVVIYLYTALRVISKKSAI